MEQGFSYRFQVHSPPRKSNSRGRYHVDVKLLATTNAESTANIDGSTVEAKIGEVYAIEVAHIEFIKKLEALSPLDIGEVLGIRIGLRTSKSRRKPVPFEVRKGPSVLDFETTPRRWLRIQHSHRGFAVTIPKRVVHFLNLQKGTALCIQAAHYEYNSGFLLWRDKLNKVNENKPNERWTPFAKIYAPYISQSPIHRVHLQSSPEVSWITIPRNIAEYLAMIKSIDGRSNVADDPSKGIKGSAVEVQGIKNFGEEWIVAAFFNDWS